MLTSAITQCIQLYNMNTTSCTQMLYYVELTPNTRWRQCVQQPKKNKCQVEHKITRAVRHSGAV